jgi:hypothetical protein
MKRENKKKKRISLSPKSRDYTYRLQPITKKCEPPQEFRVGGADGLANKYLFYFIFFYISNVNSLIKRRGTQPRYTKSI